MKYIAYIGQMLSIFFKKEKDDTINVYFKSLYLKAFADPFNTSLIYGSRWIKKSSIKSA